MHQFQFRKYLLFHQSGPDVRGVFPITAQNWDVYSKLKDCGNYFEYFGEWGFTHHFPKNGYWFSLVKSPISDVDFTEEGIIEKYPWPDTAEKQRFKKLRGKALEFLNMNKPVFTKGLCAGLFEMHQRVWGMENAIIDPFMVAVFDIIACNVV